MSARRSQKKMIYYHFLQFVPYFTAATLIAFAVGAGLKYKRRKEKSALLLCVSAVLMLSLTWIKTYYLTSPFIEDVNMTRIMNIEMFGSWILLVVFAATGFFFFKESKCEQGASHNERKRSS